MPPDEIGFAKRVHELVARIPPGRVTTYGMIARALGAPRAARTVGWSLHNCPGWVPWHRVVAANGRPAGDPAAPRAQLQWALLLDEGIEPELSGAAGRRIDLDRYGWDGAEDVSNGG